VANAGNGRDITTLVAALNEPGTMESSIAKHIAEDQHANRISVMVYGEGDNCGT